MMKITQSIWLGFSARRNPSRQKTSAVLPDALIALRGRESENKSFCASSQFFSNSECLFLL